VSSRMIKPKWADHRGKSPEPPAQESTQWLVDAYNLWLKVWGMTKKGESTDERGKGPTTG